MGIAIAIVFLVLPVVVAVLATRVNLGSLSPSFETVVTFLYYWAVCIYLPIAGEILIGYALAHDDLK